LENNKVFEGISRVIQNELLGCLLHTCITRSCQERDFRSFVTNGLKKHLSIFRFQMFVMTEKGTMTELA